MSRGKHATSSEARRARVEAETEVEAGRRKIVQLSAEVRELRDTLTRERATWTDRARRYEGLLEEGTSAEVQELRARIDAREKAEGLLRAARAVDVNWIIYSLREKQPDRTLASLATDYEGFWWPMADALAVDIRLWEAAVTADYRRRGIDQMATMPREDRRSRDQNMPGVATAKGKVTGTSVEAVMEALDIPGAKKWLHADPKTMNDKVRRRSSVR